MKVLRVLSGGAAAGVVQGIQRDFENTHHCSINGTFSAVGAMKDLVVQGEYCDVVILSKALIQDLVLAGLVVEDSLQSLGIVPTGIAVPRSRTTALPPIESLQDLKAIFQNAPAIYFPDMEKSTAGIHFMKVMKTLKLDQELADRFRTFPNGAVAMAHMALDPNPLVVGGTQTTEINISPDVKLIGLLPPEVALNTDYIAAICKNSVHPEQAQALIDFLAGKPSLAIRQSIGYLTA